jgi:ribonuclease HI
MEQVFVWMTDVVVPGASQCLEVFTDGSFDKASGSGGWAFIVFDNGRLLHQEGGASQGPSNNSLELMAVAQALEWLEHSSPRITSTVWTDSNYVLEGCSRWRAIWRNNGWKRINCNPRSRRRTIPDVATWQKIDVLLHRSSSVTVALCKGHSGIGGNEQADMLARSWMSRS